MSGRVGAEGFRVALGGAGGPGHEEVEGVAGPLGGVGEVCGLVGAGAGSRGVDGDLLSDVVERVDEGVGCGCVAYA